MRAAALAAVAAGCAAAAAPPAKVEVTALPGLQGPLPSRLFTGYIDAGTPPSGKGTMYFHYLMMESEGDPSKDPVVVWYNGGPGASSLFGLLLEFGPFLLNVNSFDAAYNRSGVPSPQRNAYGWTRHATVITIDSPPPIGFSFCTEQGPAGNGTSCGPWTDKSVFAANHAAHKTLFTKIIPEFAGNDVYFIGESYAGIYVPGFVNAMLDDPVPGLNFKGFAVGDGWWGCPAKAGQPNNWCIDLNNVGLFKYPNVNYGPWYDIEFMHGHSQISEELYREIRQTCPEAELRQPNLTAPCQALVDRMAKQVGGFYVYDVYNDCSGSIFSAKYGLFRSMAARRAALGGHAGGGAVCPGNAMSVWVERPEVRAALGIVSGSVFLNCDNAKCFVYDNDQTIVTPIYKKALDAGKRVLVYEADSDASGLQTAPVEDVFVPYFSEIGLQRTRDWSPWTTDGATRMGGYVMEWGQSNPQFVSLRGAGHMAPLNKPDISLTMISTWLQGGTLKPYSPK